MIVNLYLHCTANAPRKKIVGFAFVLEAITTKGPATLTIKGTMKDQTKNIAEVNVLNRALEQLMKPCELVIYGTPYLKNLIESWLPEWEKNGWTTKRGKEVPPEIKTLKTNLKPHKYSMKSELNSYSDWLKRTAEEEEVNELKSQSKQ